MHGLVAMVNATNMTNTASVNETAEAGIRDDVLGGTLLTINFFIIFLNSLAVLVIMRFRTKNCIDILVLGLAMTDLAKGLIPVPMSVGTYLTVWFMRNGTVACDFFGWIAFTTNSASMLILTMMAIERFVAIVKPFAYRSWITKKRMEISVLVAVLFSAFISMLPVIGFGRMKSYNSGAYCHFDYTHKTAESETYSIFILIYGFLMTSVVLAAYSIVFYKIRDLIKRHKRFAISRTISRGVTSGSKTSRSKTSRSKTSRSKKKDKGEIDLKVEKMFSYLTLGLMLLFWFSWFPFLAVLLLNLTGALPISHDKVDLFAMRVAVVNSMLNPIACASFCKPYRRGFIYYYRKLLSYAGFARPDSDVFDPWRQRSQNTREQTPGNSFTAPAERKVSQSHPITELLHSHPDSGLVSDSHIHIGRIPSILEPMQNIIYQPILEDKQLEGRLQSLNEYSQGSEVAEFPVFGMQQQENDDKDLDEDCGSAIIIWNQNRKQDGGLATQFEKHTENCHAEDSKTTHLQKYKRLKRYSMPLPKKSNQIDNRARPKSFEGFTKKYGKFRPWSITLNEEFQNWLKENAFESSVKLTGYCRVETDPPTDVWKKLTGPSFPNEGDLDVAHQEFEERTTMINDKEDGRAMKEINLLNIFPNVIETSSLVEQNHDGTEFERDARRKQRNFAKFRSKSNPTSSEKKKEENFKCSSLREDLNKSLVHMDSLTKGLLSFSASNVKDVSKRDFRAFNS